MLGGVDVDEHGVAGVEKYFDQRLRDDPAPLRLSIDVRVQAVVRDELVAGDGRVPGDRRLRHRDGRAHRRSAGDGQPARLRRQRLRPRPPDERFNRAVAGVYEPGSTFKLQTASMALDDGVVHIWDGFDAAQPIHIGRFTITDFEGKHRFLYLPEMLAYSSNIGAAHIADAVGPERQRAWLQKHGHVRRASPIELPEAAPPLVSAGEELEGAGDDDRRLRPRHRGDAAACRERHRRGRQWRRAAAADHPRAATRTTPPPEGVRVMQPATSDIMRKLMRLVVTDGFGKSAEVPGYFVGGKTGTAEKIGGGTATSAARASLPSSASSR